MNSKMVHASILGTVQTTKAENQVGKPNQLSVYSAPLEVKNTLVYIVGNVCGCVDAFTLREN